MMTGVRRSSRTGLGNRFRVFARGERGGISVFSISFTVALLLLVGLSLDTSRVFFLENRFQGVADAAALAAAQDLPDTVLAKQTAISYVEKNLSPAYFGNAATFTKVETGVWDPETDILDTNADPPNAIRVTLARDSASGNDFEPLILGMAGFDGWNVSKTSLALQKSSTQYSCQYNGLTVGGLLDYLFVLTSGRKELKWEKYSYGYVGDILIDGIEADLEAKIKGTNPFEGTLITNDVDAGAWQEVLDDGRNKQTAELLTEQVDLVDAAEVDLHNAIRSIAELEPTTGWDDIKGKDLPDMSPISFQNDTDELIVIDITDKLKIDEIVEIYGDAGDLIVMRWDDKPNDFGFEKKVEFKDGAGIVPKGDLTPANFIHLAEEIKGKGKEEGLLMTPAGVDYDGCVMFIQEKGEIILDGAASIEGNLCLNKDAEGLRARDVVDEDGLTTFEGHVLLHEDHDGFAHEPDTFMPDEGFVDIFKDPMKDEQKRLKDMGKELEKLDPNTSGGNATLVLDHDNKERKIKADPSGLTVVEWDSLDTDGGAIVLEGEGVYVFQIVGKHGDQYFNWHDTQVVLTDGATADDIYWVFKEEDFNINFSGDDTVFIGHVASERKQTINITDAGSYTGSFFAEFMTVTAGTNGGPEIVFRPALFVDEENPSPEYTYNALEPWLSQMPIRPRKGAIFTGYWFLTGKHYWKNVEEYGWDYYTHEDAKDIKLKELKHAIVLGGMYSPADKFKLKYGGGAVHVPPGPGHPFEECAPLPGLAAALMR
jgi:Flp pilus assembly protein TadG